MDSLVFECDRDQKDLLAGELCETGTLGLIEDDLPDGRCRLRAFFDGDDRGAELLARFSSYQAALQREESTDWVEVARAAWRPLRVGERFFLVPSWRADATPPGRVRLVMPPGTASGTGLHPSTQLALEAIERSVHPGDRFLDLGTGSGILSAAAARIGAGAVIACDIDEEAVLTARDYLRGSQVRALLFTGSAGSVRGKSVDVVAANIHAQAVLALLADMARLLSPGGRAVLGGFTSDQVRLLDRSLAAAALRVWETLAREEWVCLIAQAEA
jgi:ribosomal protein L11 methyltransferase